jgi:predicted GNAT superfamily acetyltransferase
MSRGSTLVSVRPNGVRDDDTDGAVVLGLDGNHAVALKWIDAHNLAISCQDCPPQDVAFEVLKRGDITITYDGDNLR